MASGERIQRFLDAWDHDERDQWGDLDDDLRAVLAERDEAWRFLACLALDGPLVILARSQQIVPWEPEFERVVLRDGAIYLRLRNVPGRPSTWTPAPHDWTGSATRGGEGDWSCRCGAVCDHESPCGRHGPCKAGRAQTYPCALCGGPLTARDNLNGGLVTVSVDGHAKAAHRECPPTPGRECLNVCIVSDEDGRGYWCEDCPNLTAPASTTPGDAP